jgi:circadian clock protein KaiC
MTQATPNPSATSGIRKAPTGIEGLDTITRGGLPRGRPTLVAGQAGGGKSVLGMEFLAHGARKLGEPGVLVSFEESREAILANMASFGWGLEELVDSGQLEVVAIDIRPGDLAETGGFDLEGLMVRLAAACDRVGARRLVLDTVEVLLGAFEREDIIRHELQRLFDWIRGRGLTAVVTAESGSGRGVSRWGIEEYVSDCVIHLDNRMEHQIATRRLRVLKYRGSGHGKNEYPFLISERGVSLLPITSVGLDYSVTRERVPWGLPVVETLLEGRGVYRGTSSLVSGPAGTGKSIFAGHFAAEACRSGGRALYFAFEESQDQIVRNFQSVGLDLAPWVDSGQLQFHCMRPTEMELEEHLLYFYDRITEQEPDRLVVDPISNFITQGNTTEVKSMLVRLLDYFKAHGITTLFTHLSSGAETPEATDIGVSSLMDLWVVLNTRQREQGRRRQVYVLKSRGQAHREEVRDYRIGDNGVTLAEPSAGS